MGLYCGRRQSIETLHGVESPLEKSVKVVAQGKMAETQS